MKIEKKITLIAIILLALVIIAASFIGIYKFKNYAVRDVVPKYLLSMDFNNTRNIEMEINEDGEEGKSDLTQENYKLSKSYVIDRLNKSKVSQYFVKQNIENGMIQVQIPDDDNAKEVIGLLAQKGKFEVVDADTEEVLLDKSNISKTSMAYYTQNDQSTLVTLKIELDKDGKNKFKEISTKYVSKTEEVTDPETGEVTEEEVNSDIDVRVDGESYLKHHFQEVEPGILKYLNPEEGSITIPLGLSSDSKELQGYVDKAAKLNTILTVKEMPLNYEVTEEIVSQEVSNNVLNIIVYVGIGIVAVLFIINVVKFKFKGLLIDLLQLAFIGLTLLIIRYTNVPVSLEGMGAILIVVVVNYLFNYSIMKNEEEFNKITLKYLLNLIPLYIIAIVFAFVGVINISSIGMILFWGLAVMFIYNSSITKTAVRAIEK